MNSFEVNTLSYVVNTLFTYRTSDRYRGFRIQLKEEEEEEEEEEYVFPEGVDDYLKFF